MLEKISEAPFYDKFRSVYEYVDGYNQNNVFDKLNELKSEIQYVDIEEDADFDVKTFGGRFSYDQFYKFYYETYASFAYVSVYFKNEEPEILFDFGKNSVYVISKIPNLDINEYIEKLKENNKTL